MCHNRIYAALHQSKKKGIFRQWTRNNMSYILEGEGNTEFRGVIENYNGIKTVSGKQEACKN